LAGLLTGCTRHKYPPPARSSAALAESGESAAPSQEEAEYYVLAWSDLVISGSRQPSCPYTELRQVEVFTRSLNAGEYWEEDKKLATSQPATGWDPQQRRENEHLDPRTRDNLSFPKRLESKLLAELRQKARRLSADAIVDVIIHRTGSAGDLGLNVQNVELGAHGDIEKISGTIIKFTDPDCRH
jgi:hypothetical protein